jgi:hypothetical protein
MLALQRMGLRPVHVHAGNVMIVSNDDLRLREMEQSNRRSHNRRRLQQQQEQQQRRRRQRRRQPTTHEDETSRGGSDDNCDGNGSSRDEFEFDESQSMYSNWDSHRVVLCGFENTLLGLPMSTPQLRRRVKKAHADGFSEVETLIFGHLFFEMAFGVALDGVVPDYAGLDAERRYYDHPVRRVLDLIFEGGGFTQPEGSVGIGFKGDFAGGGGDPVWKPRRSAHRLTVKRLCEHPFFDGFGSDCIATVDAFPREALLGRRNGSDVGEEHAAGGGSGNREGARRSEEKLNKRLRFDGTSVDDMAKIVRVVEVFTEKRWKRCLPKNRREGAGADTPMLNAKAVVKWAEQTSSPMPKVKPRRTKHRHKRSMSRLEMQSVEQGQPGSESHLTSDTKNIVSEDASESDESGIRDGYSRRERGRDGGSAGLGVQRQQRQQRPKAASRKVDPDPPPVNRTRPAKSAAANAPTVKESVTAPPMKVGASSTKKAAAPKTAAAISGPPSTSGGGGGRNALLAAIQAGKSLKKTKTVEKKKEKAPSSGGNMMAQILAQRKAIRG